MKKIFLTLAITLSLVSGFNTLKADGNPNQLTSSQQGSSKIYIKVFEDGAIWVYVYEQDGTFIGKFIENQ